MSLRCMVKAFDVVVGNPLRKLILIKLADHADDSGKCWPSYQTIATSCEVSKRTVMNHIEALEKQGLVSRLRRKKSGDPAQNDTNIFYLNLDTKVAQKDDNPSAGDSLGVVQEIHHPSAGDSLGVVQEIHQGSAGAAPKPVIEPVNITNLSDKSEGEGDLLITKKKKIQRNEPEEFHQKIIDLYHEKLPHLPKVLSRYFSGSKRESALKARITENDEHKKIEFWAWYFEQASRVGFVANGVPSDDGIWRADFEYLVTKEKFIKFVERAVS